MKKAAFALVIVVIALLVGCAGEPVTITLAAEDATLTSDGALTLEGDDAEGYNVGWWETITDEVSWDIDVESAGTYTVTINYACDPEFPGSTVVVSVGDQSVQGTIRDTSAWSSYITQELGEIELESGAQTVSIQASAVANRFVCNLRKIELTK